MLPDHAEPWLTADAMRYQEVCDAWDHRVVGAERAKMEIQLAQDFLVREFASRSPRPAEVEQAKRWIAAMGAAISSKQILRDVQRRKVAEARRVPDPMEVALAAEREADMAAVVQSMKRLNGKVMAEPQPWLGGMSDARFRCHTKDAYAF